MERMVRVLGVRRLLSRCFFDGGGSIWSRSPLARISSIRRSNSFPESTAGSTAGGTPGRIGLGFTAASTGGVASKLRRSVSDSEPASQLRSKSSSFPTEAVSS